MIKTLNLINDFNWLKDTYENKNAFTLEEDGTHVINKLGEKSHWMHGLEEYPNYIKHKQCEEYFKNKTCYNVF